MSNVRFFMEIAVVVFIFMVRQEIVVFGRVEDWSVEFVEGILDAGAVVSA